MVEAKGNIESLAYFGPELALIAAILAVIVWDLLAKEQRLKVIGAITICVAALAYSALSSLSFLTRGLEPQNLFHGLIAFDDFAHTFRILFAFVSAAIIVFAAPPMLSAGRSGGALSRASGTTGPEGRNAGEMLCLLMVLTVGMNLMAASRHLLMIYISLEMVSVISFVLAGFKIGDRKSSEGALKYVIFGGVASGVMLYGMSWIYGLTRSLNLGEIHTAIVAMTADGGKIPEAAFIGVVCMLAGFGYKISAAPFHMWTPDVYEGAPTPVTAFLSVGPKAAGMAMLLRFFSDALGASAEKYAEMAIAPPWPIIAGCLAMATMTVGNLTALNQDNVKRMLAYSSIAHAGYMLLGFSVFTEAGTAAIVFYVFAYCFMNLGAFLVVQAIAEVNGGDETVGAFRGLGQRAPVLAVVMTVFLISLAGIPPMAGFIGKFYLFAALIDVGGSWYWLLAVVGVLNSLVSLYYYARVVRAMYLERAEAPGRLDVRRIFGAATFALAVPTLILGVYWGPVYDFVSSSLTMVR
jgi:NADH-quinone oxidoreductase subunit N